MTLLGMTGVRFNLHSFIANTGKVIKVGVLIGELCNYRNGRRSLEHLLVEILFG